MEFNAPDARILLNFDLLNYITAQENPPILVGGLN
jgi:hypothetical protein